MALELYNRTGRMYFICFYPLSNMYKARNNEYSLNVKEYSPVYTYWVDKPMTILHI